MVWFLTVFTSMKSKPNHFIKNWKIKNRTRLAKNQTKPIFRSGLAGSSFTPNSGALQGSTGSL